MDKKSVLDLDLDFQLVNKKYYLTLAGKNLKTKDSNDIYCHSLMVLKFVQDDYKLYRFKSKWINLVSSYVDFVENENSIANSKDQIKSYFKNDLLFYLDPENSNFYKYQEENYLPLVEKIVEDLNIQQKIKPTTSLNSVLIKPETLECLNNYMQNLSLKDLFIALFLTRISTSSILTLLYLNNTISVDQFYDIAFNSELTKLKISHDEQEANRLEIIKDELEILDNLKNN